MLLPVLRTAFSLPRSFSSPSFSVALPPSEIESSLTMARLTSSLVKKALKDGRTGPDLEDDDVLTRSSSDLSVPHINLPFLETRLDMHQFNGLLESASLEAQNGHPPNIESPHGWFLSLTCSLLSFISFQMLIRLIIGFHRDTHSTKSTALLQWRNGCKRMVCGRACFHRRQIWTSHKQLTGGNRPAETRMQPLSLTSGGNPEDE